MIFYLTFWGERETWLGRQNTFDTTRQMKKYTKMKKLTGIERINDNEGKLREISFRIFLVWVHCSYGACTPTELQVPIN